MQIGNGQFWLGDCLERMSEIPDGSVDMVLCDLPYEVTANHWDQIVPFEPLWEHYWRICKPNAVVALTAAQPFTSMLVMSQIKHFKYDWVWEKSKASGFLNAKIQPLRAHENLLIFSKCGSWYNPQMTDGTPYDKGIRKKQTSRDSYGSYQQTKVSSEGMRYPRSVQYFATAEREGGYSKTQKPVALFDYLIRTYTNPGDLVLDNCAGSGTTAVAAEQTGRRWICIEREPSYYYAACGRVMKCAS